MLGTFQTQSIVIDGSFQIPLLFTVISIPLGTAAIGGSDLERAYAIGASLILSMLFCMVINVSIERIGYKPLRNQPRLAPLITAIGFSFILANVGLAWKGAGPVPVRGDILPTGTLFEIAGRQLLDQGLHRPPDHRLAARGAHVPRLEDEAGQGDARDRPGPRRVGDDGDQRRPHDLLHVRARRGARRGGGDDLHALHRHLAVRPRLPARPVRVHGRRARRDRQPHRAPSSEASCSD